MRKFPKHLLGSLIIAASFIPTGQTFASIEVNDTTWWSTKEILKLNADIDDERKETCQSTDLNCIIKFNDELYNRGPKYRALSRLFSTFFWVTSINPADETVKVLYIDENLGARHIGIIHKQHLTGLHLSWFEGSADQIYNFNREEFLSGRIPGIHVIYDATSEENGENWIPGWKEVELPAEAPGLAQNSSGIIAVALDAIESNLRGFQDYSSCFDDPDYTSGAECRLMFSADHGYRFFVPRPESTEQEEQPEEVKPEEQPKEVKSEEQSSEVDPEGLSEETILGKEQSGEPGQGIKVSTKQLEEATLPTVDNNLSVRLSLDPAEGHPVGLATLANTQEGSASYVDESPRSQSSPKGSESVNIPMLGDRRMCSEFPWWIVVLLICADVIIMWLFWPNERKISKKPKKGLDKKRAI